MAVQCPNCAKRVLDVVREGDAEIETKCPQCGLIFACALDSPSGRITNKHPPQRNNSRKVIDTEQRALK